MMMVAVTEAISKMTRNMVMASIPGQAVRCTTVVGSRENKMVRHYSLARLASKERVSGKMETS